ncbi:FKBP-type peptidyl-prolyl cis-trans isomerase [Natronobacterium lacisalsi]|nr:FKBP-type peptidylprolyl isomerase [Halobiforma lacisalsi]
MTPMADREYLRIDYVARTGSGRIIDTTDPDVAADSDLAELEASGPIVVVPGEGHLFAPVEAAIDDADPGRTVAVTVDPEDAFGTVVPEELVTLEAEAVAPENREPGTTVQLGGRRAVVEDVGDGTVTVDFNHPLAGVTLEYEIEILERLEGTETRAAGLATTHGLREAAVDYDPEADALTLRLPDSSPSSDRDARKRAYLEDVRRLLGIASVTVIEAYGSDAD